MKLNQDYIFPDYSKNNIFHLPKSILSILLGKRKVPLEFLKDYCGAETILLIILDGVGYKLLSNVISKYKLNLPKPIKLTTIYPSTTAAVLTTLSTAKLAGEHGMIEWNLYIPEINMLIESIPFRPIGAKEYDVLAKQGFKSTLLFQGNTIFSKIRSRGLKCRAYLRAYIHNTSYSRRLLRGCEIKPYINPSDLAVRLRRDLNNRDRASLYYVYIESPDSISHLYGYNVEEQHVDIKMTLNLLITELIQKLNKQVSKETVLILVSDHGLITHNPNQIIYLKNIRRYLRIDRNGIPIVSGSPRNVYLHLKYESVDRVKKKLENVIGDKSLIYTKEEFLKTNLVGEVKKQFLERIGDIIILPNNSTCIWFKHPIKKKVHTIGFHGGLSENEMIIPIISTKVSEIL